MRMMGTANPWHSIGGSGHVRAYQDGRICAHPECHTILSIYNATKYCTLHTRPSPRHLERKGTVREVECPQCGAVFETHNPARKYCSDRCRMTAFARRKREAVRLEQQVIH